METSFRDHLHPAMQEVLHVHQERAKHQPRPVGRKRYQQVDVTGIVRISAGHGPEHSHVADAVTSGKGEDLGPVVLDQRVHLAPDPVRLALSSTWVVNSLRRAGRLFRIGRVVAFARTVRFIRLSANL